MNTEKILEVKNVDIIYGTTKVLDAVSLDIFKGETIGLIGLNGSGKTSLIKAILGLRPQSAGDISVFGLPPGNLQSRARLAFLPERFEPAWFLTGMEFLKFSLKIYGRSFDEKVMDDAAVKLALDTKALRRRGQTYSKGMRQKLGLMGTLLTGCEFMILDEPMSGLDPRARVQVKDMIVSCKNNGQTIFLSSHILADMDEICDRIAILHEGKMRYIGTPADFKQLHKIDNLERGFLNFIDSKKAA